MGDYKAANSLFDFVEGATLLHLEGPESSLEYLLQQRFERHENPLEGFFQGW